MTRGWAAVAVLVVIAGCDSSSSGAHPGAATTQACSKALADLQSANDEAATDVASSVSLAAHDLAVGAGQIRSDVASLTSSPVKAAGNAAADEMAQDGQELAAERFLPPPHSAQVVKGTALKAACP